MDRQEMYRNHPVMMIIVIFHDTGSRLWLVNSFWCKVGRR